MKNLNAGRLVLLFVVLSGGWSALRAEYRIWTDIHGSARMAELVHAFGPMAYFKDAQEGFAALRIEELTEEDQAQVEAFRKTQASHPWNTSESMVSKMLAGRLVRLRDGELIEQSFGPEAEPDFYLFCLVDPREEEARILMPKFIKAYNDLLDIGLDNFEVIQVGRGRKRADFLQMIHELEIPWSILEWKSRKITRAIDSVSRKSKMVMILTDQEGNILQRSSSGSGESPISILVSLNNHLTWTNPDNIVVKRIHHGKFLKEYLEEPRADTPPLPHDCNLDGIDFSVLPDNAFTIRLQVTKKGFVEEAEIISEMPDGMEAVILEVASEWLFIPCIQNGEYKRSLITFPVSE